MTDEELQAIRERAEKATPGPWTWKDKNGSLPSEDEELGGADYLLDPRGKQVLAAYVDVSEADAEEGCWIEGTMLAAQSNAAFLAHARTDIPTLLAEIDRLRLRIRELEGDMNLSVKQLLRLHQRPDSRDEVLGVEKILRWIEEGYSDEEILRIRKPRPNDKTFPRRLVFARLIVSNGQWKEATPDGPPS